jgi:hypothetical protein
MLCGHVGGYQCFGGMCRHLTWKMEVIPRRIEKFPDSPWGPRTAVVQLSATRCHSISIFWVSLVSFATITLIITSHSVFIVVNVKCNLWFCNGDKHGCGYAPSWFGCLWFILVSENEITVKRVLFPGCVWNSGTVTDHSTCNSKMLVRSVLCSGRNAGSLASTRKGITSKVTAMTSNKGKHIFHYHLSLGTFWYISYVHQKCL